MTALLADNRTLIQIDEQDEPILRLYRFGFYAYGPKRKKKHVVAMHRIHESDEPQTVLLSHLILGVELGVDVLHRNGDPLDFRRRNLEVTPRPLVLAGRSKSTKPMSSKYKGVCWHKSSGRWQATISVDRRLKHLGLFNTEEEAARAYDEAASAAFGDNAKLNQPSQS